MSKEKKEKTDSFEQIEGATISTEQFIEKHQKLLVRGMIAIIVVIAIILGYYKFYKQPLAQEALNKMFMPENYFEKDSFYLALNGNGNFDGFLAISEQYGSTPSGNLSKYYAGLCYLHLGDYKKAIAYFEKFSAKDAIFSNLAKANIGDAYMQLGDFKQAANYYQKATSNKTDELITPIILMKAGLAYEKSNNYKAALSMYEKLEKEYPTSLEARDIEKYITRAKQHIK